MSDFESLSAEIKALREQLAAMNAPPATTITRSAWNALDVAEKAKVARSRVIVDGPPATPAPRPPGSITRREFDALDLVEKARVARITVIVD